MQNPLKKLTNLEITVISVILLLIIMVSVFLVNNIRNARRSGGFGPRNPISDMLRKKGPDHKATLADADRISEWMTFSYINTVFDLPPEYLQKDLQVHDSHYPEITISRYVKNNNLDRNTTISMIREKVREYMMDLQAR